MRLNLRLKYVIVLISIVILIMAIGYFKYTVQVSDYYEPKTLATHYNGANFVGSETCKECHTDIYQMHLETAHFNTSSSANKNHIKGSFQDGNNELNLSGVQFKMIENNSNYFQLSKPKFSNNTIIKNKIDIVLGSGVKGQSHLSWKENELYQLQVSYFEPTDSWVNSPNFPEYSFKRPVDDNCLKCHVTFAKNIDESGTVNMYDKAKTILGIDCERCHGPSEEHVKYQRSNPEDMNAKYVDDFRKYSRQQRLDACAVCHSGLQNRKIKGNQFSFLAGDTLALYSKNYNNIQNSTKLDVHGNQIGLLSKSKCFKASPKMDCITCHDPHRNQRGQTKNFNLKCLSCHDTNDINRAIGKGGHTNQQDCISCHMPLVPSEVMKLKLDRDTEEIPVYIRTHLIGVYDKNLE